MFTKVFMALRLLIFLLSQLIVSSQSLSIECGISFTNSTGLIYNGVTVGQYEYPW